VRRAVWRRDQYQCAFRSDEGRRCEARSGLEIDHIQPVARGGGSTVDNLRLLCRAHNQLAAEKSFGAGFMEEKREAAKRARTR
jgi:5-methylcytosine-specific restriction endonuclease McrA